MKPTSGLCVFREHMGNPALFYGAARGFTAYMLHGALTRWLGKDVEKLADVISHYIALTPPTSLPYMNTFLENHDVGRAATAFGEVLEMGHVIVYSLPGVPSVHASGERGEEGKAEDHTDRRPYTPCHIRLFGNY